MPQVGLRRCCRIAKSACLRMYPRGTLEHAQKLACHESARTMGLYDRRDDEVGWMRSSAFSSSDSHPLRSAKTRPTKFCKSMASCSIIFQETTKDGTEESSSTLSSISRTGDSTGGYWPDCVVCRSRSQCLWQPRLCCSTSKKKRSTKSVSIRRLTPQERRTKPDWR